MFGILGEVLGKIPDLRKIEINASNKILLYSAFAVENFINYECLPNNGRLFSCLHLTPIFQSDNGLDLATGCLQSFIEAQIQACKIDRTIDVIQNIFDKLVTLHPASITKQLERSLVVPKLRYKIDPQSAYYSMS